MPYGGFMRLAPWSFLRVCADVVSADRLRAPTKGAHLDDASRPLIALSSLLPGWSSAGSTAGARAETSDGRRPGSVVPLLIELLAASTAPHVW